MRRSLLLVAMLAAAVPAAAGEDTPLGVQQVRIGLDGTFKVGSWTALEFDVTGPAGRVFTPVIRTADPDGQPTQQPLPDITLSGEEPVHVRGLFRSGRLDGAVQIQLFDSEKIVHTVSLKTDGSRGWKALQQQTQVWVSVGDQPVFERGLKLWNAIRSGSVHLTALPDLSREIWSSAGLDGVDVLVVNADAELSVETSRSLQEWVSRGGNMIVPVGNGVARLADSPLADWIPIRPEGQLDISKLNGINALVPRSSTLRLLTTIPAAGLSRTQGSVIATGLTEPLVVRSAYGIGQVTLVAIKLDQQPLSTWEPESQGRLAAVLAGVTPPHEMAVETARSEGGAELNPAAVTDLQMQLNHSLDSFSGISRSGHWGVMGWIALFILCIGPLDFALVHYYFRRPEWTWLTLPAWIVLASWWAVSLGNSVNDRPAAARQLDMVDLDLATGTTRVNSWYVYYSVRDERSRIDVKASAPFLPVAATAPLTLRTTWPNRPGEGFRGMSRSGGIDESRPEYRFFVDQSGIENLPTRIWSSGAVNCQWESVGDLSELISADLVEHGPNQLSGTIRHQLPAPLHDWFLAYGNFAYFQRPAAGEQAPALEPGMAWDVSQAGSNLLRGRLVALTQSRSAGEQLQSSVEHQYARADYDPLTRDPLVIGLAATFFETMGGKGYTGLENQSLTRQDLSRLLKLDRAILFGRIELSPTEVAVNSSELPLQGQTVLVRMVLPVKRIERTSDAPPPADLLKPPK